MKIKSLGSSGITVRSAGLYHKNYIPMLKPSPHRQKLYQIAKGRYISHKMKVLSKESFERQLQDTLFLKVGKNVSLL